MVKLYKLLLNIFDTSSKLRFVFLLLTLISLTIIVIRSYFPHEYIIMGQDTFFHLNRFLAISEAVRWNHFPIYIDSNILNAYGYGTNLFYPDFFLIPFALLIKPFGVITAYKCMIFTYMVVCGLVTYYCIENIFKNYVCSFLTTILYTFSMYHLLDMALRGALGEFISFIFLPLVLWGGYEIIYGDYRRKWYIIGLGFVGLLLTHMISGLLSFVLLCLFLAANVKKILKEPKRFQFLLYAGLLSILLSAFFLLPMFEQMIGTSFYYKTNPLVRRIAEQAVPIRWIVWGMFSGLADHAIKIQNIGILLIFPLLARLFITKITNAVKSADMFTVIGFVLLIMCSNLFPWDHFPFNKFTIIQFPWRVFEFACLFFACAIGVYLSTLTHDTSRSLILIGLAIAGSVLLISTQGGVFQGSDGTHLSDENTQKIITNNIAQGEYIPSKIPSQQYILSRGDLIVTSDSLSSTSNLERGYDKLAFDITTQHTNAILPLLYYKGYEAKLNGNRIELNQSKDGLVQVHLPASGQVIVSYTGTLIQKVSVWVSLLSVFGLSLYLFWCRKKKPF